MCWRRLPSGAGARYNGALFPGGNIQHDTSMNNDLVKGILIVVGLFLVVTLGGIALTDNGWQKAGCVGRAITSGIALSSVSRVCGF